jgi:TonB family protein
MKRTLVAILALSPVLAFAQTNSPAQPRSTQIAVAHTPANLPAASSADRAATASTIRVSTGVTPPHVISTANFVAENTAALRHVVVEQHVVVALDVDATGKPSNLAIVKSAGDTLDKDVLATVSQYRFKPGTLDGQPTTVPVRLEVVVPAGTTY